MPIMRDPTIKYELHVLSLAKKKGVEPCEIVQGIVEEQKQRLWDTAGIPTHPGFSSVINPLQYEAALEQASLADMKQKDQVAFTKLKRALEKEYDVGQQQPDWLTTEERTIANQLGVDPQTYAQSLHRNGGGGVINMMNKPAKKPFIIVDDFNGPPKKTVEEECVLELDEWDKTRGVEIRAKHPSKTMKNADVADFHAACYLPEPKMKEEARELDQKKTDFMLNMMDTPNFQALRKNTVFNRIASELATNVLCDEYVKTEPKEEESLPKTLHRINKSVEKAQEEVALHEDTMRVFNQGGGSTSTSTAQKLDQKALTELFQKVQKSAFLRDFMRMAGRYRRSAMSKQRTKVKHGVDEVIGVERGNDLSRMLPHELVQFAIPKLRASALHRYVERQSLIRQTRSREKLGKGPVVICVDGSYSMHGDRIKNAKAMALGMWWIAQFQKRWCWLVEFGSNSDAGKSILFTPKGQVTQPQHNPNPDGILQWVEHFYGAGGTSPRVPFVDVPGEWKKNKIPEGKTDMVLIGDGGFDSEFNTKMAQNFHKWKTTNQVSLYSIMIGVDDSEEFDLLRAVSDSMFFMSNLNVNSECVDACFSI